MMLNQLRSVIADVLSARRFVTRPWWPNSADADDAVAEVFVEHTPHEELRWEVFRGHLVDPAQTRATRELESWRVFRAPRAPVVAIHRDINEPLLFVTRSVLVHGWEAYEPTPGVIDSRPVHKWTNELVGTLTLENRRDLNALRTELAAYLDLAVRGLSRLPITSLEAPLPDFALGKLLYLPSSSEPGIDAVTTEFHLRSASRQDVPALARFLWHGWSATSSPRESLTKMLLDIFNNTSLTPFTGFAENLVTLLRCWMGADALGPAAVLDIVSTMLRLLTRHLTAFDLQRFHSFGANYPDALVLDALLKLWIEALEAAGRDITSVVHRRAFRQAWLLRKQCEQLRVPDSPTSLGENQRVLPEPFYRVPEEQIRQPNLRTKRLLEHEPAEQLIRGSSVVTWQRALAELIEPRELLELGVALFLDRPLGQFKAAGEVDRTPLLSYEAFSRSIAEARLQTLQNLATSLPSDHLENCRAVLRSLAIVGIPVAELPTQERPGVVTLGDARQAAEDFVFLRTTRRSLAEFVERSRLCEYAADRWRALIADRTSSRLLIRTHSPDEVVAGKPVLQLLDDRLQPTASIFLPDATPASRELAEAFGVEFFRAGYRVQ